MSVLEVKYALFTHLEILIQISDLKSERCSCDLGDIGLIQQGVEQIQRYNEVEPGMLSPEGR